MTVRLLALTLLCVACAGPKEWVREYDGYIPGTGYPEVGVILVRDKETGRPIANALIRQHEEAWPSADGHWAQSLAEAQTDEYGIAWVRLGPSPSSCHWAVYAEGYAPTETYARYVSDEVELERGHTERGQIIGPFGEPVAGATVEYKVGCAHAPALATTTTDANGVFVFHGIEGGDFTYRKPGIQAGYASAAPLDEPMPVEYASVGDRVSGRIIDRDGKPPAWGVVHYVGGGRGELALLAKDGSFRLESADAWTTIDLYLDEGTRTIDPRRFAPGYPGVYHLESRLESKFDVSVDVDGFDEDQIWTSLTNLADGRIYRRRCGNPIPVPRGRYRIGVGGPFSSLRGTGKIINVARHFPVRVEAVKQPALRIEWEEPELRDGDVTLTMLAGSTTWNPAEDGPTHLPAAGRAVLWVERMGALRVFEVGALRDGVRAVRVTMPGVKRLRLPLAEWNEINTISFTGLDLDEMEDEQDHGLFLTRATGPVQVTLEYPGYEHSTMTVELPERSESEIVLDSFSARAGDPDDDPEPEPEPEAGSASVRVTTPDETVAGLSVYVDG